MLHFDSKNPQNRPRLRQYVLSRAIVAITILGLGTTVARAQFRASIQGTVTDPQGEVIPGATLTLTDTDTNHPITAISNGSGVYNFNALAPDHYNMTVTAKGFKEQVIQDLHIIPEQPNSVDVRLELGEASTSVTVSGDAIAPLETATASTSGVVSSNQIQHMPSAGRDVFQLAQLAPGVFGDGSQGSGGGTNNLPGTTGPGGSAGGAGIFQTENNPQVIANGAQNSSNGISIDGISTVSAVWGGASIITPNEDSVDNVKIVSNSYDAENGRFSGAGLQVTSKSGTNDWHGSLFFRANRPGLNAYQRYNGVSFYNPANITPAEKGLTRDTQQFNQYGGSVGGPVWKDHVFAFFAYETIRNSSTLTATSWYDTPAFDALAPANSIASTFLTFPGAGVASSGLIDQNCASIGLIEGTNCHHIPGQGLNLGSPLTSGLGTQDLSYQNPTNPGVGNGLSNTADIADFSTVNPTTNTDVQYNGRIDADITQKDHIAFAIYWVPVSSTTYNGPVRPYNLFHHDQINDAFSIIWNHIFSATFLNEARANAAGWRFNEVASNPQAPLGLPQDTVDNIGSLTATNTANTFQTFGFPGPADFNQWTYTYKDVATKVQGNHTIKFGGELTRLSYLNNPTYAARPTYNFYNIWDFLNDAPHTENGSFSPITGTPTTNRQDDRQNLWGFFVQDDWKARPNLTFNLGLRYTYFDSLYTKQNNLSTVVLGSGADAYTGLFIRHGGHLWSPQKGNFGPQMGFAWSPGALRNKFVLRGGFGLNYNEEEIAITGNAYNNPPGVINASFTSGGPTSINPAILYAIAPTSHSLFGFPPNPNTIGTFNTAGLPVNGGIGLTAFPAHLPTAYTEHFSLDTQYDLGHQLVATVGYSASVAHHTIIQSNAYVSAVANGTPLNPLANNVDYFGNYGAASYNALLLGLKQAMAHHFQVDAQFQYSKSLDNTSQPYYEDPYPFNSSLAWGPSDYNVGKAFKIYGVWQPVIFSGNHAWLEKIVGGWSLSGIFNLHTGFPWMPTVSTGSNLYYPNSGYTTLRPAAYLGGAGSNHSNDAFKSGPGVGNGVNQNFPLAAAETGTAYYVTPAFTAGSGVPELPGVGRNSLVGPGYKSLDGTLTKAFGLPKMRVLGENARIEIRADAFNFFNNLNFNPSSVSNNITATNFGQAQSALSGRIVNLQARFSF
jgi:Carboxypeptidase regulatory-like domain